MKRSSLLRLLPVLLLVACDTGTEPEGVLFSDDFSGHGDGSFPDGWTQFDMLLRGDSPRGLWYVQDEELVEANDTWGGYNDPDVYYQEGTVLLAGDENWGDYRLTVDVTPAVTGGLAVYCRTKVIENKRLEYYRVFITDDGAYGGPFWRLDHRGGGEYTVLARNPNLGYIPGETFRVIIEVTGNIVRVFAGNLNDLVLEWDGGDSYSFCHQGRIALMAFRNPGIAFDNVLVEEL
ncbi:MAG TPA: hypothetical protein VM054_01305 [bacterium]|nr:hypothetical protein [bacterium]